MAFLGDSFELKVRFVTELMKTHGYEVLEVSDAAWTRNLNRL